MRKLTLFFAVLCCSATMMAQNAVGDIIRYTYMGNNLYYKVKNVSANEGTVSVIPEKNGTSNTGPYYSEANKPTGDLVLPDTIEDSYGVKYAVKELSANAFNGCTGITSFTNNNLITAIYRNAFYNCKKLATVDLKNVTSISDYAFAGAPIQDIKMDKVQSINMANFGSAVYTTLYISKNLTSFDSQSYLFCSRVKKVVVDPENVIFKEIDGIVYKKLNSENFNCIVGCVKDTNYLVTIPECVDTMVYRALEDSYLDLVMPSQKVVGVKYIDDSRNGIKGKMYVACHLHDAYVPRTGYYKAGNLVDTLLYNVALVATNGEITREKVEGECEQVKLTAVPDAGYKFDKWSDGETANPRVVTVTEDTAFTALFVASSPTGLEQSTLNGVEVRDGSVYYDGEFRIFDTLGRDVTRMNGKLNGVYMVRSNEKSVKIVVR